MTAGGWRELSRPFHPHGPPMIDMHYWTTPNCHKIKMFLEETELTHRIVPVNLQKDEQLPPPCRSIRTTRGEIKAFIERASALAIQHQLRCSRRIQPCLSPCVA